MVIAMHICLVKILVSKDLFGKLYLSEMVVYRRQLTFF